jgi:hypothetical protein
MVNIRNLHQKLHILTKFQKNRHIISLTEVYRWGHLTSSLTKGGKKHSKHFWKKNFFGHISEENLFGLLVQIYAEIRY